MKNFSILNQLNLLKIEKNNLFYMKLVFKFSQKSNLPFQHISN